MLSVPLRTYWERIFWNSATLRIRATYGRASSRYCPWLLLLVPSEVPGGRGWQKGWRPTVNSQAGSALRQCQTAILGKSSSTGVRSHGYVLGNEDRL